MITLNELETQLGYDRSSHYHRIEDEPPEIETAHLFRVSREVGVRGIYTFETSPVQKQRLLPARPAVYVAEAETAKHARQIHRSLWNLSYAPFVIIRLPHQIRVYTGFSYAYDSDEEGRITEISDDELKPLDTSERLEQLHEILSDFHAASIDTGQIWKSEYANQLDPEQRVDEHLLRNLKKLGTALKRKGLRNEIAHALIGKYVYLHYLRDRQILSEAWLLSEGIDPASILGRDATVNGLRRLVEILEDLFNGRIFPIDFDKEDRLNDSHVSIVSSIFMGDEILDPETPEIRQLHLDFQAYDFRYIPVETLSAIYEQFIIDKKETRREKGAIYKPEILADYLLSEIEWAKKLERGMKILDPACGSGVFLVLAYRRLIEKERARLGRELTPDELKSILEESIYGVERERDVCYVAEFSLILTLLHYLAQRDLQSLQFQFPDLHNTQIFECDFFDQKNGAFWQKGLKFDCIVGNPPWITANAERQKFAHAWISKNKNQYPVGDLSVAEAVSWQVTDLLTPDGVVGLILPATSLFNQRSNKYRQSFFTQHEVLRITNFANIEVLFGKGKWDVKPTMTVIYRADDTGDKGDIVHYGPFSVNQVSEAKDKPWVITINKNEIQTVSPYKAATGELTVWKFALWGNHLDERAVRRIKKQFPMTLEELKKKRGWFFNRAPELRTKASKEKTKYTPELKGKKKFDSTKASKSLYAFSVPNGLLQNISDEECYIRIQGGEARLSLTHSPHIVLSCAWRNYLIYSDEDFVIPRSHTGIVASKKDADYLKALSIYLHSSLVGFYLFFHAEQWGIYRRARQVLKRCLEKLPIPEFTREQIDALVALHKKLVNDEKQAISNFIFGLQQNLDPTKENQEPSLLTDFTKGERKLAEEFGSELRAKLQREIDDTIFSLFRIPRDIQMLVNEFIHIRLALDDRSTIAKTTREPTQQELLGYARELQAELDGFLIGKAYHRVYINQSEHLIECVVEITKENETIPITEHSIKKGNSTISATLANISDALREQISQWVYVQRGLRLFDGPRIYIYKAPRLTKTQAINDAGDIIGQAVSSGISIDDNNQAK